MRLVPAMLAALLTASPTAAQAPDFEGFWNLDFGTPPVPQDWVESMPPDTVIIRDTGVVEFPQGEFGGLRLLPEAREKAARWKPEDEMRLDRVCAAPSVIYSIQGPFPFEIHQTPELIVFKYEYFDQVRLVFMDGRDHPPAEAPHSKMGFSTGRWEGDELVIETSHIAPSTITNNGLDHSDGIRMVERYRLIRDGAGLEALQWFSDPATLENNGARHIVWRRQEGWVLPYDCDPSIAVEYQHLDDEAGE